MNKKLLYILLALVLVCSVALTACNLTPTKVTITYKYNYEGAPADKTVNLDQGASLTLETPTREGYTFEGWFTDADCTKAFTDKTAKANVTLYAKWKQNEASHTHDLHYQSSSSKHWQECSCGYTTEQVDHTFDANNTCVCGYKQGGTAHTHSWATDWSKDATNHWHVCTGCSELNDKAAHDTNGTDGACSVCGYKAAAQGQAVTVYFYTADWTTVNAYAWTDTPSFAEHLGGWPGTAINAVSGEEGWYSVEVPAEAQSIIFNDGASAQTADLVIANGPYFVGSKGYATKAEAEAAMSIPEVKTTLYYYTTAWTTVYAYTWQPEALGTWPGTQATAVDGETGWYSIEVPAETVNILFNIGDDSAKTSDLLVANGPYFVGNAGYATKEEAEEALSTPAVTTYTLKGGFDNWGAGLAFEAHEEGQVKLLGVELEAGVQFKVYITDGQTEEWISALEEGVTVATKVTDNNGNENITVSEAGIYDLYFKIEAKQLYIAKVVEEHEHVTEGTYVYDDNGHWVVCTCGEKVLEAAHVPGAEATETEPQICTVCEKVLAPSLGHEHVTEGEYVYDENNHWVVCDCEEKVLVGEHDFANGDCVCGAKAPVVLSDYRLVGLNEDWTVGIDLVINPENENEYMLTGVEIKATDKFKVYVAAESFTGADPYVGMLKEGVTVAQNVDTANTNSDIKVLEDGKYDIYFDITTNVIWIAKAEAPHEHVWSTDWSSDDTNHWHACTGCDDVSDSAAHVPGDVATEETAQICTECKKVLVPALGHEHVTEGEYVSDENGHWVVCTCEQKVLEGAHDFTNGDCVCGAKAPVEVEKVTVYFQNNWLWTDVKAYYWTTEGENKVENGTWPGVAMTLVVNDGTYDIYSVEVPVNVTGLVISGIKNDGSGTLDKTPDITIENKTCVMYYMVWEEKNAVAVAYYHTETTETVTEPDCTNAGEKKHTCTACGNVRTEVVAAGHTFVEGVCSVCGEQESAKVEDSVVLNGLQEDVVLDVNAKTDTGDGRLVEYMLLNLVIEEETLAVFVVNGQYGNNAIAGYDSIENKDAVGEGEEGKILLAAGTYSFYFKVYNTETSGTYKYVVWVAYTHNHTYTKQSFSATEHWMQCSIEGCTAIDATTIEAHDNAEDCTICDFVASEVVDNNVLYLTPNANWKIDNARFAAYFFGANGNTWVSMTYNATHKVYEVEIPEGSWTNVIFCRMNPGTTDNNWDNKWNQTADLNLPMGNEVHYTVKEGTWDNGGGTWSALAE